jgi:nucleotide-binding universal stress UspA family protein
MSYRTILLHLKRDPLCAARTQFAIRLARKFDCVLVGLAPTGLPEMPVGTEAPGVLMEMAALSARNFRDEAEAALAAFSETCRSARFSAFEAIMEEADDVHSLVSHANTCDLVVLSQANPNAPGYRFTGDSVERVLLQSARPTLLVPYAGRFDNVGENILVAWDGSRAATRALSDAMPFLRRARSVQVISWSHGPAGSSDALRPQLASLHRALLQQDVRAVVQLEPTTGNINAAMLSRAADLGSDLIVMGAYGHARWAERIIGGATRGMLGAMTVPVLMSH